MSLQRHQSRWHLLQITAFLMLLLPLALAACGGDDTTKNATPTPAPTNASTQMVNFDLGIPKAALDSPVVGDLPGDTLLKVNVSFKPNEELLNKLDTQKGKTDDQTDAASYANQLGITDQQYAQIKSFFGVQDAKLQLSKLHTNLSVEAKASSLANLLHTKFVYHQYQNRKFFAPATQLQLPKQVADQVIAINGLDSYKQALKPGIMGSTLQPLTTRQQHAANADCTVNGDQLLPKQIRTAYGYSSFWNQGYYGKGTTIILPELAAFNKNDVQNYLSCVGYRGKLSVVNVAPAPDPNKDLWGGSGIIEATLDIQMVAGMAPDANIVVYQTDGNTELPDGTYRDPLHDVLRQIVDDNTNNHEFKVVSVSWGGAEKNETQSSSQALNSDLQYLTRVEHMTVFTASGDCGAYSLRKYPGELSVDFPSASPYSVGVGGTQLTVNANGTRASEVVWSESPQQADCDNSWGSGGGISELFAQPKWQTSFGIDASGRAVPDVSAVATDIAMYIDGQWVIGGGTSAATPIWAAGWSLTNQQLINKTRTYFYGPAAFYAAARNNGTFFDVRQGDNLHYKAGSGYDMTSGLGTPDLPKLYQALYPLTQE